MGRDMGFPEINGFRSLITSLMIKQYVCIHAASYVPLWPVQKPETRCGFYIKKTSESLNIQLGTGAIVITEVIVSYLAQTLVEFVIFFPILNRRSQKIYTKSPWNILITYKNHDTLFDLSINFISLTFTSLLHHLDMLHKNIRKSGMMGRK